MGKGNEFCLGHVQLGVPVRLPEYAGKHIKLEAHEAEIAPLWYAP